MPQFLLGAVSECFYGLRSILPLLCLINLAFALFITVFVPLKSPLFRDNSEILIDLLSFKNTIRFTKSECCIGFSVIFDKSKFKEFCSASMFEYGPKIMMESQSKLSMTLKLMS